MSGPRCQVSGVILSEAKGPVHWSRASTGVLCFAQDGHLRPCSNSVVHPGCAARTPWMRVDAAELVVSPCKSSLKSRYLHTEIPTLAKENPETVRAERKAPLFCRPPQLLSDTFPQLGFRLDRGCFQDPATSRSCFCPGPVGNRTADLAALLRHKLPSP